MSGVFANGLEVSGQAVAAKTIAVFPDVCFTPPENPATPPGLPVPYPSFGLASDTDKGTGTVKIGGKTVNIKNKSHLTKTTGTESGCSAKKGLISSKNTGKEHFRSWSSDVKFDGEPVVRHFDLATNNHGSDDPCNTVTWPHIKGLKFGRRKCSDILNEIGVYVHPYKNADKRCEKRDKKIKKAKNDKNYQQSDHLLQNANMSHKRHSDPVDDFENYKIGEAPCICLQDGTNPLTEHGKKTQSQNATATAQRHDDLVEIPYTEARDNNLKHTEQAHPKLKGNKAAMDCLRQIVDKYMSEVAATKGDGKKLEDRKCRVPATKKPKTKTRNRPGRKRPQR